jgi:hypothetical protein
VLPEGGADQRDEGRGVRARHLLVCPSGSRLACGETSGQLEVLAELEVGTLQSVAARGRRVGEGAPLPGGVEVRALLAREAEGEARGLVAQSGVHDGPHGRGPRVRWRATTVSTWLVCGNISKVAIEVAS